MQIKRARLRKEGIGFPASGKSELIRLGEFDHSDIILTTHVHMMQVEEDFYLGNAACNGFSAERVTVRGKAAHAALIHGWRQCIKYYFQCHPDDGTDA